MAKLNSNRGCCSVRALKRVLYIFNVFFLLAGLLVLGYTTWLLLENQIYVNLLTTVLYPMITYFLLFSGILTIFGGVTGIFAGLKDIKPLLLGYIFLIAFIFLLEVLVAILGYLYIDQPKYDLETHFNESFISVYNVDHQKTTAVDFVQKEFKCCGALSYADWLNHNWNRTNLTLNNLVPDSCCKSYSTTCGVRDHPSNIFYKGCVERIDKEIQNNISIIAFVGLSCCILDIIGVIYACQLYIKMRQDFQNK